MNIKSNAKQLSVKLILGICIILLINLNTYSYVFFNRMDEPFESNGEESTSINSYIINGAEYYLKGYSDFLVVLNRVEKAPAPDALDFNEVQKLLDSTISTMEKAKETYEALKQNAGNTPYNPVVIDKLLSFDYSGFCRESGLNKDAFSIVTQYLGKGDARGVFNKILTDTTAILNSLNTIKSSIDMNRFPLLSNLWRLNQRFAETLLFGQYCAEVMFAIGD